MPVCPVRRARRPHWRPSRAGSASSTVGDEVPEPRRAGRVDHQVDTGGAARIHHAMAAPGVEYPALAGGHVDAILAAMEHHRPVRDHRDVNPHTAVPVIVEVHVQADFTVPVELHQSRPRQDLPETGHHLPDVRAAVEMRRRCLCAFKGVVVAAAARDQRDRRVARQPARMPHPRRFVECAGLHRKPRRVELIRQPDEWFR